MHIVLQCHSQSSMQKLVRNSVTCHLCRYFPHLSSFFSPSPIPHSLSLPCYASFHVMPNILGPNCHKSWRVEWYIHVHIVLQCHSQSNMQKLIRNSVTCHPCRYFLHFSSFYSPSPIPHFSFPPCSAFFCVLPNILGPDCHKRLQYHPY